MEANVVVDGVKYDYHVTEDGKVFSLNYNGTGDVKELKCSTNNNGYRYVQLYKNKKKKTIRVSRLVALTYIPNPHNKPTVDHINRIRTDDRVSNLRWATSKEQVDNRKELPKNNKLSKPVRCIETGVIYPSVMEARRQLGFDNRHISDCCNSKRKTAHGYHWQYVNE